jgi:hypothetical protein
LCWLLRVPVSKKEKNRRNFPSSSRYVTGKREKKEQEAEGNGEMVERMLHLASTGWERRMN